MRTGNYQHLLRQNQASIFPRIARYLSLAFVATTFALIAGSGEDTSHNKAGTLVTVSGIAKGYTNYHKITDHEVYVNPLLAMLCRGATQAEVEAAREKDGPHANTAILIYMNDLAADAFGKGSKPFPVGSVVVKRKTILGYRDNSGNYGIHGENGVGGMVKRAPGYDPAHGDWEYFYFDNPAKIQSGRIDSCVKCHETAKGKDYVFGTWKE
jgi:hypothetical protein